MKMLTMLAINELYNQFSDSEAAESIIDVLPTYFFVNALESFSANLFWTHNLLYGMTSIKKFQFQRKYFEKLSFHEKKESVTFEVIGL